MTDDLLERAASALRAADGGGANDDALIDRALLAGRARHARRTRTRRAWVATAVTLAAAAAIALAVNRPEPRVAAPAAPLPELDRVEDVTAAVRPEPLVRGDDRLTPSTDARFRLDFDDAAHRLVTLRHGAMLFDLAPLPEGHVFAVRTPHLEARVTGTVFLVEVQEAGTAVEVFEGSVLVLDEGRARLLRAGQRVGDVQAAALRVEGEAAARARGRAAPIAAANEGGRASSPAPRRRRRANAPPRAAPPTPEAARALIVEGEAEEALALARSVPPSPTWRYVEADALRALGRGAAAASAYDDAAGGLEGPARREAAVLAAQLHMRDGAPERALASLERGRVTEVESPLRERGLVLKAEALAQLERHDALARVARAYLRLYPTGHRAAWMGRFVDVAAPSPGAQDARRR